MSESTNNLKHIVIEGFKSIKKLDLAMDDINILVGANGSGKTNLVSVFTFLEQLSLGKLHDYVDAEGGADLFFHFGTSNTALIKLDLEVGINGYHVELSPGHNGSLVFDEEYCTMSGSGDKLPLQSQNGESRLARLDPSSYGGAEYYIKKYLARCCVYHFYDTGSHAGFKKANKLANCHYLEKDAANIAPFLYHLREKHERSYRNIIATFRMVAPFIRDFYLEPTGEAGDEDIILRWIHAGREKPLEADALSDGTARFICLATLLLQPEELMPGTIILDEPELGMHPTAIYALANIIQTISRKTQVICATQSVSFANYFASENFIVVDAKGGVSEFRRLEKDRYERWLDMYGMGDIWAKNLVGGRPEW